MIKLSYQGRSSRRFAIAENVLVLLDVLCWGIVCSLATDAMHHIYLENHVRLLMFNIGAIQINKACPLTKPLTNKRVS
jgi:hypothetical protein